MAYSKEKQQKLVSSLTNIGALAGTNSINAANGIKGLGMSLEQSRCDEEAKAVRDGLFKVVVMGTFTSGKSTVINALIGSKMLPESIKPCTAILTFIQYGKDEDRVDVYMADKIQNDGKLVAGECVQMSVADFQNEYKYTLEDEKEVMNTGTVARFTKVKYAIMYSSKSLMENGICIIDSPGLEDKAVATELALDVAQKAQAIIFLGQEKGFSQGDKDYILSAFRNCPNNVFFVLNRYDIIKSSEERKEALDKAKLDLSAVFTKNGEIDKDLLNRRVFGVSAMRALDSRRGMWVDPFDEKEKPLDEEGKKTMFERSWFRPFEKELETFLTTDEKCVAQYQKCFTQMASTYRNVEKQIADYITVFEKKIQMDETQKAECKKQISGTEKSIQILEQTFDNCVLKIQNEVASLLNSCAGNLDGSWEQDMTKLSEKVDVGTLSYMWTGLKQMNPFASKQQKEEDMKEFTSKFIDVVTEYFVARVEKYIKENSDSLDRVVKECEDTVQSNLKSVKEQIEDLAKMTTPDTNVNVGSEEKSWIQILLSAYLGDFSRMIEGAQDGKAPWIEFLKKTLFNTVWQAVLVSFIDGGLGVFLALGIEYVQGRNNKNNTVKKLLNKSKDGIIKAIREKMAEAELSLSKQIAVGINKKKEEKCAEVKQQLNDQKTRMSNIEKAFADHNFNLEEEKKRYKTILDTIYQEAVDAYAVVNGEQLSLQKFKTF